MDVRSSTLEAIGNTPLIKLRRASEETGLRTVPQPGQESAEEKIIIEVTQ